MIYLLSYRHLAQVPDIRETSPAVRALLHPEMLHQLSEVWTKTWPSEEFSFGQRDGPRGGSSKTAPEQAFPSDVESQATAKLMQSFASQQPNSLQHQSMLQDPMASTSNFFTENKTRITNRTGQLLLR